MIDKMRDYKESATRKQAFTGSIRKGKVHVAATGGRRSILGLAAKCFMYKRGDYKALRSIRQSIAR